MFDFLSHISNQHPAFSLSTTVKEALSFFKTGKFNHFPVVENEVFIGHFSFIDAETLPLEDTIDMHQYLLQPFFLKPTINWLEILEAFFKNETNLIAVLDEQNKYVGYLVSNSIAEHFKQTPFINENGSTLIVEKEINKYSLSEITQIVESNNSKLLGVLVSDFRKQLAQISIKMISNNVNEIIQTFRRYDYEIVSEHIEDNYYFELKKRSEYLDKYLNI